MHFEENKNSRDRRYHYQYDRSASPRVQTPRAFKRQWPANAGSRDRCGLTEVQAIEQSKARWMSTFYAILILVFSSIAINFLYISHMTCEDNI